MLFQAPKARLRALIRGASTSCSSSSSGSTFPEGPDTPFLFLLFFLLALLLILMPSSCSENNTKKRSLSPNALIIKARKQHQGLGFGLSQGLSVEKDFQVSGDIFEKKDPASGSQQRLQLHCTLEALTTGAWLWP